MSNMDLRFGRLGTFNTKILKSRTVVKSLFLVSCWMVLGFSLYGIILLAMRPSFLMLHPGDSSVLSCGFWKSQIINFQTIDFHSAQYVTYQATNTLSANAIAYLVLASFSIGFNWISYLLVRYYKGHNTVNYHLITLAFSLSLSVMYILITTIGMVDKIYSQSSVYYQLNLTYQFNFIYNFNLELINNHDFVLNYSWRMGGIAFVGFMIAFTSLVTILFVWFSCCMLFRQPHFRYDIYYTIYDEDKQKRGIAV